MKSFQLGFKFISCTYFEPLLTVFELIDSPIRTWTFHILQFLCSVKMAKFSIIPFDHAHSREKASTFVNLTLCCCLMLVSLCVVYVGNFLDWWGHCDVGEFDRLFSLLFLLISLDICEPHTMLLFDVGFIVFCVRR